MHERQVHVEDGKDGVYFLCDPETREITGTLIDQGTGWWKCRTPSGSVRELWVPPATAEPWRYVAERVAG